jgi:hypothetical protein
MPGDEGVVPEKINNDNDIVYLQQFIQAENSSD